VVELALQVASLTYGALLGTYLLGGFWPRARERDVIVAMVVGVIVMVPVIFAARLAGVLHNPGWLVSLSHLAWPWDVPLGTVVTVVVGMASSFIGRPTADTTAPQAGGKATDDAATDTPAP
jgi:Na+/proline symporter